MNNDEKIAIAKKRTILLILIVVFGISTLVLSLISLTERDNIIFLILAIISFVIESFLSHYRNKLSVKEVKPGSKNQG